MIVAVTLDAVLIATAPISEGRYGLFILIAGQAAALVACLEFAERRPPIARPLSTLSEIPGAGSS